MGGVLHNLGTAGVVVVVNADFLADVFLGDAQLLLNAQLNGQAVSVPASLAVDQKALQRLVSADDVLNATRHNVVNARHSVSRRRTFEEDEFRVSRASVDTFLKGVVLVPLLKDVFVNLRQVQLLVFWKFTAHNYDVLY